MNEPLREPPRIMIVDDMPQNLALLEGMLRDKGWQVFALPSGAMALQAAAREQPDLILLDVLMPGLDGYEVCTRLKADPRLKDIPVLFLSALNEPWDKARAFQAGGVDYISKPFQIEDVEVRVQAHLRLRELQQELAGQNDRLEILVRQRTEQLADAHARLALLDQAKSDFLTIISHELRTPLSALFSIPELLLLELPDSPRLEDYRQMLAEAQQRLLTLVEDALLLAQVQTASAPFSKRTSALGSVLPDAIAQATQLGQAAGVTLAPAPPTTAQVVGDPSLLTKALQSLLETVLKFSARGGTVRLLLTDAPGAQMLSLEARGYAIPPAELPRFFDLLAISKTLTPGGDLGLAPALARCLIGAFGGQVRVENLEPPGIRITVRLGDSADQEGGPAERRNGGGSRETNPAAG
ncbi:MAG: hybrid sensor histidine kinase/response regulator [Verrucomicrobiota bacterium]